MSQGSQQLYGRWWVCILCTQLFPGSDEDTGLQNVMKLHTRPIFHLHNVRELSLFVSCGFKHRVYIATAGIAETKGDRYFPNMLLTFRVKHEKQHPAGYSSGKNRKFLAFGLALVMAGSMHSSVIWERRSGSHRRYGDNRPPRTPTHAPPQPWNFLYLSCLTATLFFAQNQRGLHSGTLSCGNSLFSLTMCKSSYFLNSHTSDIPWVFY